MTQPPPLQRGPEPQSLPKMTLVVGGARSGKSRYAEGLMAHTAKRRVYIATAQAFDDEMHARIDAHRVQRGPHWVTLEAPLDLVTPLQSCTHDCAVLLDCATLWLSNQLLAGADLKRQSAQLMQALASCRAKIIIVSNEVGCGIVPENALARRFRDAQGQLNQQLAAQADRVITVIAGLPLTLKP